MMSKRLRALPLLSILFPLPAALLACGGRPAPDNVVLVTVDTLRRDHLATYGYPRQTAPFLDQLAREGAVFDGLSPTSWTKPATASLLSGLHPLRHQAVGRLDGLPEPVVTLAERLRDAGYTTLGMSANGWISAELGFGQGFSQLLEADSVSHAEEVNRTLLPWLERLTPPFFLYVHYIDPHAPYEPRTAWDGGALQDPAPVTIESLDPFTVRHRPAELLARVRDLYDGEIRGADRGLEQLVGELTRRGLMKNTVLVVTSDHGEEIEEHGRMGHGMSLYEEAVQVPLVFHAPHRIAAGRHGRASLLDVVPTLEEMLGLKPVAGRPPLDGVSQAASLRGQAPPAGPRPFLFHLDHMDGTGLALTRGPEKLVLGRRPYRKEIFDLAADPGERNNLLEKGRERDFARLAADLAGRYNDLSRGGLARRPAAVRQALRDELAALGYAAPGREGDPRRIPRRIDPADPDPDGLLGWEGELPACVQIGGPDDERHLLRGWNAPETGGRWSKPEAVLLLGAPADGPAPVLVLSGVSYRPDAPRVTVRAAPESRPLLAATVPPGPFRLSAPLPSLLRGGPVKVEITTAPAYVPSEHGQADSRPLGLLFSSACLQPAGIR